MSASARKLPILRTVLKHFCHISALRTIIGMTKTKISPVQQPQRNPHTPKQGALLSKGATKVKQSHQQQFSLKERIRKQHATKHTQTSNNHELGFRRTSLESFLTFLFGIVSGKNQRRNVGITEACQGENVGSMTMSEFATFKAEPDEFSSIIGILQTQSSQD